MQLPDNAVFEHVVSQFIFRMNDEIAQYLSFDKQGSKNVIFLHNAKYVDKDKEQGQKSLDKCELLIQLLTDSVLKSKNNYIIGRYSGPLFDLALLTFILTQSKAQRRINLEYCIYRMVTYMVEHLEEFIKNGAWMKVSNSPLFLKIFKHYQKMFNEKPGGNERIDVYGLLILSLYENMRKLDLMIKQNFNIPDTELAVKEKIQDFVNEQQSLNNANLENCLAEAYIREYLDTSDDPALIKKHEMVVLDIDHSEWTNFKFAGAQKVSCTFEAPEGFEETIYKLEWKNKVNDEEF